MTLVGLAFVDDTDLCVHGPYITSTNVQSVMQNSLDNWEGLLRATGGMLVITKQQKPAELSIKDDQQHHVAIPRLEKHDAQ